jgi:hypothetical protein
MRKKMFEQTQTSQIANNHFNRFHSFSVHFSSASSTRFSQSIVNLNARPRKVEEKKCGAMGMSADSFESRSLLGNFYHRIGVKMESDNKY